MVLKDPHFKSCERIYTINFLSFSQNQIFRYFCRSVLNCSLIENVLDTFCVAQIWEHIGHYSFGFLILSGSFFY